MTRTRLVRCFFVVAGLALVPAAAMAQSQEKPRLPIFLAAAIPDAIERGKNFLLSSQQSTGTWSEGGHRVGYAALPALALLECGVPPNHISIQAAANFVRSQVPAKDFINTYEVSLALLFLDRLGNRADIPHIETLAGRLVASQTYTGGWGYRVQYLDAKDTKLILGVLRRLEPAPLGPMLAGRVPNMDNPFVKRAPLADWQAKRTYDVPKHLQALPCFTQFGTTKMVDPEKHEVPFLDRTDNSTTQFALLALWAARRHGIPCTRTGSMTFLRFHTSQNANGSWGYPYGFGGSGGSAAMINTGLFGMAVGHGLVKEMKLPDDPPVDADPRILHGFKALSAHIGTPVDRVTDIPYPNMYFLWSMERVCMLYDIHMIGDKDWYRWGAEALVANQDQESGSWFKKDAYPGAAPPIDTSFALMFLKRANLAKDLSAYLAFSPKKLNDGVIKLTPPPVVAKPAPKPEPPKVEEVKPEPPAPVVEQKPEQKPVQVAEAPQPPPRTMPIQPAAVQPAAAPAPTPAAGGMPWWIWLVLGLGGLMIVGGILFFFLFSGGSRNADDEYDEDEEEEERPRKKSKKPRRR
ncbi:MAG: hypothetical protein L0Y71_09890 [Gemmataceae bacterium]|nr:hypothetical protein [Gemmataceae bacterium]